MVDSTLSVCLCVSTCMHMSVSVYVFLCSLACTECWQGPCEMLQVKSLCYFLSIFLVIITT